MIEVLSESNIHINPILAGANVLLAIVLIIKSKEKLGWLHSSIGWGVAVVCQLKYYGVI